MRMAKDLLVKAQAPAHQPWYSRVFYGLMKVAAEVAVVTLCKYVE
jgi:hypothetical protein